MFPTRPQFLLSAAPDLWLVHLNPWRRQCLSGIFAVRGTVQTSLCCAPGSKPPRTAHPGGWKNSPVTYLRCRTFVLSHRFTGRFCVTVNPWMWFLYFGLWASVMLLIFLLSLFPLWPWEPSIWPVSLGCTAAFPRPSFLLAARGAPPRRVLRAPPQDRLFVPSVGTLL